MIEILSEFLQANLALVAAVALSTALGPMMLRAFGAEVSYLRWLLVPLAVIAVIVPAPTRVESAEVLEQGLSAPQWTADRGLATAAEADAAAGPIVESLQASPVVFFALVVWLAGATAFALALLERQRRFRRSLGNLVQVLEYGQNVYRASSNNVGPCLVWVREAVIVIPPDFEARFSPAERNLILLHERAHAERGDLLVNLAASIALCLFWCNPAAHLGSRRMRAEQEIACDARIVRARPADRKTYVQALLRASTEVQHTPIGCALDERASLPERFAALTLSAPSFEQRLAGALATGVLCFAGCGVAWASQPPRAIMSYPDLDRSAAERLSAGHERISGADLLRLREIGSYPTDRIVVRGSALIVIVPEIRTDVVVEASTGQLAISRLQDRIVIDTRILSTGSTCRSDSSAPLIVLRTPQKLNLDVAADSFVSVGAIDDLGLRLEGCSAAHLTGNVRDLSLIVSNNSVFATAHIVGDLSIIGEDNAQASFGDVSVDAAIRAEGASRLSFGNVRERSIESATGARVRLRARQRPL